MRYQSKPEDEELDQDVINSIKELGYSTIDVNRDIHVKNTHVWNLYKWLLNKKQKDVSDQEKVVKETIVVRKKRNARTSASVAKPNDTVSLNILFCSGYQ